MTFPISYVERLFDLLSKKFGAAFYRQFDGLDLEKEKQEWCLRLGPYRGLPQALLAAIEVAEAPPSLLDFVEILQGRYVRKDAVPAVRPDEQPEWVGDGADWIRQNKRLVAMGVKRTPFIRAMIREGEAFFAAKGIKV